MDTEVSYAQRIAELAASQPDEPVLRFALLDGGEPVLTWAEIHRRSSQLAGALASRGVGLGDRVALSLRNSPELVLSAFAAWKLGAVPVPVRWDVPDWERSRVLDVIAARTHLDGEDLAWIRATDASEVPHLPDAVAPQSYGICSSGSTGTPKVILAARPGRFEPLDGTPFAEAWGPVPRPETILVPAPMYHTNGFHSLQRLLAGDRLVLMEKFDAARALDLIERYHVSTFTATPTMLQRIADRPDISTRDLSSIHWILQGAAPMPASLVHRWAELIGAERIVMAYGMTEQLGLTALRGDEWMLHPGSVGRSFRDTEIRILDAERNDVATGEVGEIFLRSPTSGEYRYLGGAPMLRGTDDGFETAGDLGSLDDDGYLYLADRRVDLIITGGANVFPAEVECALIDHPQIADIVVIGLQDPAWGRRVHAVIEASDPSDPPTTDAIIAYAKSRLAAYKVPKTIEFVDAIPRSEATKVNRWSLVESRGG